MPANWVPRAALKADIILWAGLLWTLHREARRRSYRPAFWRRGVTKLRFKKGDPTRGELKESSVRIRQRPGEG